MMTIVFPDRETEKKALAFLIGHYSGKVFRNGEHILSPEAVKALAEQGIPFSIVREIGEK